MECSSDVLSFKNYDLIDGIEFFHKFFLAVISFENTRFLAAVEHCIKFIFKYIVQRNKNQEAKGRRVNAERKTIALRGGFVFRKIGKSISRILSRVIIPLGDLLPDPSGDPLWSLCRAEHALHIRSCFG